MEKTWIENDTFKELSIEQIEKLDEEQVKSYNKDLLANKQKEAKELQEKLVKLQEDAEGNKEEIAKLNKEIEKIDVATIKEIAKAVKVHAEILTKQKESGKVSQKTLEQSVKDAFDEHADIIKDIASGKKGASFAFEIKGTQGRTDITGRDELAPVNMNVSEIPYKPEVFRALFREQNFSGEYYKELYQATVARDAKNVALCAAVSTTTKETIAIDQMQMHKVKDMISFCLDFITDYPFMATRIRDLLTTSLALKIDQQLLSGTGVDANYELRSIDFYASEFSAVNPVGDVESTVVDANYVDLIKAMNVQIMQLGKENKYMPDTVVVNAVDWYTLVDAKKDGDNNYLDYRITTVNGQPRIGNMRVVTSPEVTQNTCYVFDSRKGTIFANDIIPIEVATMDEDDWQSEAAKIKGYERLNLYVSKNDYNAFMGCSDVATAIAAINKV